MTDQAFTYTWRNGGGSAFVLSGNSSDTGFLYPTGRSNSSGTRITVLSETAFGRNNPVIQYTADGSGNPVPTSSNGNGGLSSSQVAALLGTVPNGGGSYVSYLGIPDAADAVTNGGRILNYNGVAYTPDNVRTGKYSLWGFQQMYRRSGSTTAENTFDGLLRPAINNNLGTAGISLDTMLVDRSGGDGGLIFEK